VGFQKSEMLSQNEMLRMVDALRAIRQRVRWKPGKDIAHIEKRRNMQHIPFSASLSDYEKIIADIVGNNQNMIYLYDFAGIHFYGVRGLVDNAERLVIFGAGGLMETAFPPRDIDDYISHRGFIWVGLIDEVLTWTKKAVN
jgi:hypothetical protein